MHAAALHLVPILGAEKSKTPFYIVGAALILWALFVSMGVGMRRAEFPSNIGGQRLVIAITAALVLGTAATAVATSGTPSKAQASSPASAAPASVPATPEASATSTSSASAPASSSTASAPSSTAAASSSTASAPPASSTPPPSATSALKLAANPEGQLSYSTKRLSAKAGKVTINFTNASPVSHNVTIAQGSAVLGATPTFQGGAKALTLKLKPGVYTFYCSVPGHRQAGMEGTLTIS